jgi:DNA mismatch repair protein MutL
LTVPATAPEIPAVPPRIAVLPSDVADQIAAGEVVERPASVVKELVENALDAGATAVTVTVEEGGRALIRVADDGHGMPRDDAVLALARHATSKIRRAADLVGVPSFGFRGEALPAICSVSEVEIETADPSGVGTRVRAADGHVRDVHPAARARGTTVTVRRLFEHVPARRKFLRGARSEWRAIAETLATIALVRRDLRLVVTHDGREQLHLPPAPDLRARVAALHGRDVAAALLPVDDVHGAVRVHGAAERPADVGTHPRRVFVAVNGRAVRDAGLVRAAEAAYRSTLAPGLRPSLFLEVTLPGEDVDVNVHPAKAEVRFRDRWAVERVVERAVRAALGTLDAAAGVGPRVWTGGWAPPPPLAVDIEALRAVPTPLGPLFSAPSADGAPSAGTSWVPADGAPSVPVGQATGEIQLPPPTAPPLVQFRRTFLAFEHDDGLVLIDQHSAHERVLYERFLGALTRGDLPAQRLLFPLTVACTPAQLDAFEAHRPELTAFGFEAEPFGGGTLAVHAVPNPHPRFDAARCLRETLDALTGDRFAMVHARHERLAATVACQAAIKAGEPLAPAEMRQLYLDLATTTLPAHDVHGRATVVRLRWDELERRFGRQ